MSNEPLKNCRLKDLLLLLLRRRSRFKVTGRSMLPLITPGDILLVDLTAYRQSLPQTGDIVVAIHPHKPQKIVKRVAKILEDGSYFTLGDNLTQSTDSRSFGSIELQNILGKVCCRFN